MRQVLYVSAAAETFRESDLESILESSRRNNPEHGVTGMLLYMDLGFLQILEGPDAGVEVVLAAVRKDSRHENFCVLIDRTAPERLFAGQHGFRQA